MSSPVQTPRNRSSGIPECSATSLKCDDGGTCTDNGLETVAKTDTNGGCGKNGKKKRYRRLTNRRYDPLKRRTLAEWRAAFEALGEITIPLICCARKVYCDYPYTAPITNMFREPYQEITHLPDDKHVTRLLVKVGYPPLQAERALALTGRANGNPEADRIVNRERQAIERARLNRFDDDDDDTGKAYVFRWSYELNVAPRNEAGQKPNPMLDMRSSNSASLAGSLSMGAGRPACLGLSVRAFFRAASLSTAISGDNFIPSA